MVFISKVYVYFAKLARGRPRVLFYKGLRWVSEGKRANPYTSAPEPPFWLSGRPRGRVLIFISPGAPPVTCIDSFSRIRAGP